MATKTERKSRIDIELPEVLTEQEGAEREQLADEFRVQEGALAAIQRRPELIRQQLDRLTEEYVDADERRRTALLTERTPLAAELTLLPKETEVAARKYAAALLAWSGHVYTRVEAVHNRLIDELNPQLRALHQLHERADAVQDGETDREAIEDRRRELAQAIAPVRERQAKALEFCQQVNALLGLQLRADCKNGHAEASVVDRWVADVRRHVERKCA
jgi:hypothetical protein